MYAYRMKQDIFSLKVSCKLKNRYNTDQIKADLREIRILVLPLQSADFGITHPRDCNLASVT